MKRPLYAFLILSFCGMEAYAQLTSCTQTLRFARSTYDQGRLHEIPALLENCLRSGFSQQERVEANRLLCLSYIYLEEPAKADKAMLDLLRTDHYFEIKPESDPAEFVALYRTFRTNPIYRVGSKLGVSTTQPNVISYIPANDGTSEYTPGIGFQGGIAVEIPILNGLTFAPEINFALKNFNYINESSYIEEVPPGMEIDPRETRHFKTTGKENHTWISLPIILQYDLFQKKLNQSKIKPYVGMGISTDYLINASNKFLRTKENASSLEEQTINLTSERKKINLSAIATAGVKVKVTGGFALAEVRYSHGLSKVNNNESTYSLFDKTFPTGGYVDGIFRMNSLSVTIGYVYNIFNPKKLKN